MGKYGETALIASRRLRKSRESACEAWQSSAGEMFAGLKDAPFKACPREAFLGLCAAGLISGVSPERCSETNDSPNRAYSTTAVELLLENPELSQASAATLWRLVMVDLGLSPNKTPNQQMDVVLTLWKNGLIVGSDSVR